MEESRINPPAQVEMIALDNLYEKDDVKLKQKRFIIVFIVIEIFH